MSQQVLVTVYISYFHLIMSYGIIFLGAYFHSIISYGIIFWSASPHRINIYSIQKKKSIKNDHKY